VRIVSVGPPPDRLCWDLARSAWEFGDLGHAAELSTVAVSQVVAGHPISSHTLLWPALVVEPAS